MHVRSLFAVGLAALLATPSMGSAQAKKGTSSKAPAGRSTAPAPAGSKALSVGGFVGFELGDADGFALRVDGEMPFQMLAPKVALSFVGSLGYTRFSQDVPFGDSSTNIVKLVPAARFTIPLAPELDVYGDGGLGLYYFSSSIDQNLPFVGRQEFSDSGIGFMLRLAAGGFYKVNPKLKIGAELGLLPYFGDVDTTEFTIMGGVMFAL